MEISAEDRTWMRHTVSKSRRWYDRSSRWNYLFWRTCQLLSILGSALAAVMASHAETSVFKWVAVAASFVATIAAASLSTFKFSDLLEAREIGRIAAEDLENRAFLFFASEPSEKQRQAWKARACQELLAIERQQLTRFFDVTHAADRAPPPDAALHRPEAEAAAPPPHAALPAAHL